VLREEAKNPCNPADGEVEKSRREKKGKIQEFSILSDWPATQASKGLFVSLLVAFLFSSWPSLLEILPLLSLVAWGPPPHSPPDHPKRLLMQDRECVVIVESSVPPLVSFLLSPPGFFRLLF
jgi:hypothetical protein